MTEPETPRTQCDPGYASVRKFLLYGLSLPERTLRSGIGVVGGALRESSALLVPQAFQSSKSYSVLVKQMLDYLVEDVGGVARKAQSAEDAVIENFVARKAVGNFVEMASLATLHMSPLTLLAVLSDVAYGSQTYLRELGEELKRQGVIEPDSTIQHADDLLRAIAEASANTATAFDTPPMSVAGLRETIQQTREAVGRIDPTKVLPRAELERLWREMHAAAAREGVSPLEIGGAMTLSVLDRIGKFGRGALSTVRVAGVLLDRHVIDHYENALADIQQRGLYTKLSEVSGPYIEAVWSNFASERPSLTEDLVTGKHFGQAWRTVRRWFGYEQPPADAGAEKGGGPPDAL